MMGGGAMEQYGEKGGKSERTTGKTERKGERKRDGVICLISRQLQ